MEAIARRVMEAYAYQEIRTPIFEKTELFARGVGQETDIVSKEMFTWQDRDESSLTLRPENTAGVIRAYLEHSLDQRPGLQKLYYIGPMFRRERPQKGRYRQFSQIGAEVIGSESPAADAEVIEMVTEILRQSGLEGFTLILNSVGCKECRPKFIAALKEQLASVAHTMCQDCQRRSQTNPLRVLDCKIPEDQPIIDRLPSILDNLCSECAKHFTSVRRHLDAREIEYAVTPRLVRGLDYYMRTTFEVVHGALGAQNSLVGGGRYDGLTRALNLNSRVVVDSPGIGFSIGEDRLVMSVEEAHPEFQQFTLDLFLAPMGAAALSHCALLARELRRAGVKVELAFEGRLKRVLELANKLGARHTLIVGDNEIQAGAYQLKNMASGEQETVTREQLAERFYGKH